ncbi:MAG: ATP-binding cassette domain-containing protein [Christensenellaceae bacterium]
MSERDGEGTEKKELFGCADVVKWFGRKLVLDGARFLVPYGGVAGIFGLNGSGKTTLLRILAGLDRDFEGELSKTDVNLRSKIVETLIMQCGGERLFIVTTHEIKEVETLIDGFFILKDGRLSPYYSSEKVRETTGNSVAEFYRRKVNE